jgi:ATP-dependent protease HslVU (ClpYQ) peptidase subunit
MTTIAYRDGVIAADSRVTIKDFVDSNNDKKIYRLSDGSLFGASGDLVGGLKLLDLLKATLKAKKFVIPNANVKSTKALFITPYGTPFYYEAGYWEKRKKNEYLGIGTGGKYALAAMDAGADAITACRIGAKRDIYSGGTIRWLEL